MTTSTETTPHSGSAISQSPYAAAAVIVLALAALPSACLLGQAVDITGYLEHTLQIDYASPVKEQLIDASKLRLDFTNSGIGGLEFRANINLIVNHGTIEYDLRGCLPEAVVAEMEAAGIPPVFELDRERTYLDNAFLTWESGRVRVRAGKQQLSWGPAYSFNPTDLFHRKNILDPTYEKEGVTALRFDYTWGVGGRLAAIAAPRDDLETTGYALRIGTHVSSIGYDVALTLHQVNDSTSLDPSTLAPVTQRRRAAGVEFSGELLGLGIWMEGNYNDMEIEQDFARAVLGLDYTFGSGLYLLAEGLFNGRAEVGAPYPTHDWLANLMFGEPVGRWWILGGARQTLSDLATGSLYVFTSPAGSAMLNPRLDVSVAQNADLVIFGGIGIGKEDGAFPAGLYSMIARATVYF
jgi:hypothetical protein